MFNRKIFGVALSLGLFFSAPLVISAEKTTNVNFVKEQSVEKNLYKTLDELVNIFVNDKKVKDIVKENLNKNKKDLKKGFPDALKKLEPYVKKKLKDLKAESKNKDAVKGNINTLKNVLDFVDLYKKNSKFKKEVEAYIEKIDMKKIYEKLYSSNLKARNKKK